MNSLKLEILRGLNLLLVEDDEELRNSLSETLSIFFKKIFLAKDGQEALEIYQENSINVIITDYIMPKKDGCELTKEIRRQDHKVPIVIISSYSDREKLLSVVSLGLTEYMIKPIEYGGLLEVLIKIAENLEQENALYFSLNEDKIYNFLTKEIVDKKDQKTTKLSKSEIIILELLLNNINKIVSLETISYSLSAFEPKSEQAIKNIIHRLRLKLTINTIFNVQGVGYIYKIEK